MGILNLTPDSFSDGGQYSSPDSAWQQAERLVAGGADIVDVGAESSRPGAVAVSPDDEILRLRSFVERWSRRPLKACLSIDTRHAKTARWALAQGAQIINDISGSPSADMVAAMLDSEATYVLMHNAGSFEQMHEHRAYGDVTDVVEQALRLSIETLLQQGLPRSRLWIDPGLGFAKSRPDNWQLVRQIRRFSAIGPTLLVGPSRKRFLWDAPQQQPQQPPDHDTLDRKTAAICAFLFSQGAQVVRVHHPAACREAMSVGMQLRSTAFGA